MFFVTIAEEKTPSEIAENESAWRPIAVENENDWRVRLDSEADKGPIAIGRSPQFNSQTGRGRHSIERVRAAIGVNGDPRFDRRCGCDHPGPASFAGHSDFRSNDLANQADEILKEVLRAVLRIDSVSYFEQSTALLSAKSPTTRPGLIG